MRSEGSHTEVFVWVWLPGAVEPVVAGRLTAEGSRLLFHYGQRYLARDDAIALCEPELPLRPGVLPLRSGLSMPGCIRDASPDAWGRRVIVNRMLGARGASADTGQFDELTYLLESGSDRAGALDFQHSPAEYVPREADPASLEQLQEAAERVEQGLPLSEELAQALQHGTSLGGARPKAQIAGEGKKYIAKFSSASDLFPVVKAEFVAMRLAARAGLNVASASHMPRSVRHFERVGLAPIASPTHFRTGRGGPDRLSYWVPSSGALGKTERAVYETLGLWALEWDHRGGCRRGHPRCGRSLAGKLLQGARVVSWERALHANGRG